MRIRKEVVNKLLDRTQFVVDVAHPGAEAPSRDQIKDLVAKRFGRNKKLIVIFGLHTKFGGGRTTGFGLIYDNEDVLKQVEPFHRLLKAGMVE